MTTPNSPSQVEEILEEFYEITNVAVAIQSGMLAGRNSEQELADAWERVNDWLRTTLTELEAEKGRAVEDERKRIIKESPNLPTDVSGDYEQGFVDASEGWHDIITPKQTN